MRKHVKPEEGRAARTPLVVQNGADINQNTKTLIKSDPALSDELGWRWVAKWQAKQLK